MEKIKLLRTVHPPKQPSLLTWLKEYKVGLLTDPKFRISDRSSDMNQHYSFQKLKA